MKVSHLTRGKLKGRLVDCVRIYARGGAGGQGAPRLGGVGGDGGNVKVVCAHGCALEDIVRRVSRRFIARSGGHSGKGRVWGERGKNMEIPVPPGTVVYDSSGKQLCDLDVEGSHVELVKGGRGGRGVGANQQGQRGERGVFLLELKVIADVGMVGFPNAGKSTLLRKLSNATPKVADYPYLPGLVEGAYANVGMGHRFLRHVERTKVLLYVVDVGGFQLSPNHPHRDALETVSLLARELESYQRGLSLRPSLLVVNKMDVEGAVEVLRALVKGLRTHTRGVLPDPSPLPHFSHILPTSALRGEGVEVVKTALRDTLVQKDMTEPSLVVTAK